MLKIGELAKRSGCPVETIRYYERIGLLMPPQRTGNNYRAYSERHAERLQFIRHCRALDMGLDEIRVLLEVRDAPEQECTDVNELLDRHIERVGAKIAELATLERQLTQLRGCCVATRASHSCGILHALSEHEVVHQQAHQGRPA
jgi:Cd(II)/Pb(II)-responsive transcriptional regulator